MNTLLDKKTQLYTYYYKVMPKLSEAFTTVYDPPEPAESYIEFITRKTEEAKTRFVLFTPSSCVANNYLEYYALNYNPPVSAIKEVLQTLDLTNTDTYLNFNAGGTGIKQMAFYNALKALKKLKFKKVHFGELEKSLYAFNITTLDPSHKNRARYKVRLEDLISYPFSCVLGSCTKQKFEQYVAKCKEIAVNYIVIFSDYPDKVDCTTIFTSDKLPGKFFIWDLIRPTSKPIYKKVKSYKFSEVDYIRTLRRL